MSETHPDSRDEPSRPETERLAAVVTEIRAERERDRRRFLRNGIVDQAVGILIARSGCTSAEAFEQLADLERRSSRGLLDIAADLVGEAVPAEADTVDVRRRPEVLAMDRADDAADLAQLLVQLALDWSGPTAAAVAVVQPDGVLRLVGSTGFPARAAGQWQRIPPAMDCLFTRAVRTKVAVWANASAPDLPPLLGEPDRPAPPVNGTRLAVPLYSGRKLIGAIEIAWPTGTDFAPDARREIVAVAQSVAPALVRALRFADFEDAAAPAPAHSSWQTVVAGLGEPAMVLTPLRDSRAAVLGFRIAAANGLAVELLSPGSELLGRRLLEVAPWVDVSGAFEALRTAFETGIPYRDDAVGGLRAADGALREAVIGLTATRIDGDLLLLCLRQPRGPVADPDRWSRLARLSGVGDWEWDLAAGRAIWSREALAVFGARVVPAEFARLDALPYTVHPDDVPVVDRLAAALVGDGRSADAEFRIVRADGTVGHVRMAGEPVLDHGGRTVSVHGIVQDVSDRRRAETALEITKVQLAAQRTRVGNERHLASLLQQIILPVEPVVLPGASGVDIAARYRPASVNAGVGGDWYGFLPLPDGRVLMTVGDVAGHGLTAASAMARLYQAWRGLAVTGAGPAELLTWLNTLTCDLPAFTIASACCALYDPAERRLRWANAGHPPPVLVGAGGAAPLRAPIGTMLGAAAGSTYQEAVADVVTGDVVLFYTDGLVERRGQSHDETTVDLLALAADPEPDLDAYLDRVLAGAHSDTDDDTCLIAARFR